jgi:Leucine-rich repeat (LRR) protein
LETLPSLRYLDIQSTHLNLSRLTENTRSYLIYLRVNNATGSLLSNDSVFYPNLQILDLSGNSIQSFSMVALFMMPNLKTMKLSNNPLAVLYSEQSASQTHPLTVPNIYRQVWIGYDKSVLQKILARQRCAFFVNINSRNVLQLKEYSCH